MFKTKEATYNFIYSFGAAIVILGALFKMTHWSIGPISGNVTLAAGLITEAIIFIIFAFDAPKTEESYAWENVYPELLDSHANPNPKHSTNVMQTAEVKELELSLSDKLDKMLADAKLDVSLFDSLRTGIEKFSHSVDQINQTVDVGGSTAKYNDQLMLAASHLESMNALYALQLEHGKTQTEYSKKYVDDMQKAAAHSEKFNEELTGLTSNLNSLNRVYGGMLSAMKS
ncbi:gliding motility protein GldL [Kaistella flava (ex Peng et al. 2021)]|uniref:Gliding motility protein GldL n=1 Tax=Kaistella flava (ex Peng et al. 2021) TaxID=2038776 RepID=A0A7M2YC54_9FLAO|nr:gliding motility protein GldL [Kaistella flava (ex Peng et al. 2021)]QOW11701.1 gliding motility protein GldL [Kaistella flava (ex Peng et al. 2021)]